MPARAQAKAKPESSRLLSGNEAIAHGAWEAGVRVGCGYPGTPSTEILEALARLPGVACEWAPNEKVALEVAVGASVAGGRALCTMKHVGVNVAADPLFSAAYMGVNGGLVVVSADDPGMHSSQNEQDNRLLARAARVALLEPADAQEARDYAIAAFDLSETHDVPVLLRTTTRVAHSRGLVTLGQRVDVPPKPYRKNPAKYVVLPAHGRARHAQLEGERLPALEREAERWAREIEGSDELAIITAGAPYLYAREAFPEASVLKLGLTHPLPSEAIRRFAQGKRRVVVVEELEPYLEEQVRALGVTCEGKNLFPRTGELSVDLLRAGVLGEKPKRIPVQLPAQPARPPILCAGCAHRGAFYALKQLGAVVAGDIGCYTLGALPPLAAMDTCMNMGASVGMAHGMGKVFAPEERKRLVAVIGDSTFFHSGVTGLVNLVYNGGDATVVILDNGTTAMTGHQDHPGTGCPLCSGASAGRIDLENLCRGLGLEYVRKVDPYDLTGLWRALDEEMNRPAPSVVIVSGACVLKAKRVFGEPLQLDRSLCTECGACTLVGCPAIEWDGNGLRINPLLCVDCSHCQQVCADCNAGIDIPQALELVDQKRYREAVEVVLRANPFPGVSSRVCPHPCDHEVNALGWAQERRTAERYPELVRAFPVEGHPHKLSVQGVERFLGDYALQNCSGAEFAPREERPEKVAVVGGGPAGLTAAWFLRRQGFQVSVLEQHEQPGGMMRFGIPAFRLPRDVLDGELDRLAMIGVEFRCGVAIGTDVRFDELEGSFDAVVVAVGDSAPQPLDLQGTDEVRDGLLYGLDFLRRYNRGQRIEVGDRVGVVGGGNTAIDCARAASRLGAEVTVYYRRTDAEMPALRDEIASAQAEGIGFEFLVNPTRVLGREGRVRGLELIHMKPGPLDGSGRRRPLPVPGSEFEVATDTVILAVGERAELGFLSESGLTASGSVKTRFTGATDKPGVFACGDVAFGHGTVTQGVSTGRRVAEAVAGYLKRKGGTP